MKTPIYVDFDQIVFEGRPQEYGAYQMRKRYNRILSRAMIIGVLLFLSVTALPKMVEWVLPKTAPDMIAAEEVILEPYIEDNDPIIDKDPIEKIEVPQQPAAPAIATLEFNVPTPTPDDEVNNDRILNEVAAFDTIAVGAITQAGVTDPTYPWDEINKNPCPGCPNGEVVVVEPDDDGPDVGEFILLEKEPAPVNMDELKSLIGYPPMALEADIEGKVTLRVMVDKHGDYVKHVVLKDPHPILTKAVTDKIHHLKTTPGIQAGKPIKVWVTLPFNFEINR